jgi:hypothetical protein
VVGSANATFAAVTPSLSADSKNSNKRHKYNPKDLVQCSKNYQKLVVPFSADTLYQGLNHQVNSRLGKLWIIL